MLFSSTEPPGLPSLKAESDPTIIMQRDFSHETNPVRSRIIRIVLITTGTISLGLGIAGIVLPVLPTTPFLLLTALCYARSSVRFYNALMNHRYLGPYIHQWRIERTLTPGTKVFALSTLAITIISSVVFFIPLLPVKILVAAIGLTVAIYIWRIPTRKRQAAIPDSRSGLQ